MLVLSRKVGERIRIADDIEVIVKAIQGDRIKIGIEAPRRINVRRGELTRDDRTGAAILEVGTG